jgi:hypothetical protein
MICIKRDVTDPAAAPLLMALNFETTADGHTSIKMPDGTYAYQEPNQYGVFRFTSDPIGAYQRCIVQGQLVAFWTRPQDKPFAYSWVELPN